MIAAKLCTTDIIAGEKDYDLREASADAEYREGAFHRTKTSARRLRSVPRTATATAKG